MDNQPSPPSTKLGRDDLLEDLFGLNVRGLKSIGDSVVRPRRYFAAARVADWQGTYTPSARLVFSILTLLGFFSFFWAGEDSWFVREFIQGIATADAENGEPFLENPSVATDLLAVYAGSLPFTYLFAHGLASMIVRVWGRGAGLVARLRLHMVGIVPSMTLTLFSSLAMPLLSDEHMRRYAFASLSVVFLLDLATVLRGGVVGKTLPTRLVKSATFATASMTATMLASLISGLLLGAAMAAGWI